MPSPSAANGSSHSSQGGSAQDAQDGSSENPEQGEQPVVLSASALKQLGSKDSLATDASGQSVDADDVMAMPDDEPHFTATAEADGSEDDLP